MVVHFVFIVDSLALRQMMQTFNNLPVLLDEFFIVSKKNKVVFVMIIQVLFSDIDLGVWVKLQLFCLIPVDTSEELSLTYSGLSLV